MILYFSCLPDAVTESEPRRSVYGDFMSLCFKSLPYTLIPKNYIDKNFDELVICFDL